MDENDERPIEFNLKSNIIEKMVTINVPFINSDPIIAGDRILLNIGKENMEASCLIQSIESVVVNNNTIDVVMCVSYEFLNCVSSKSKKNNIIDFIKV